MDALRTAVRFCAALAGLAFSACGDTGSTSGPEDIPSDVHSDVPMDMLDADGAVGMDGADAAVDMGPWARFSERPCPPDSALTWENFGAEFVLGHCTGCHGRDRMGAARQGAPPAVTFDGPPAIRDLAGRIWAMAADDNTEMPPVGGPAPEERRLFGEWLACGAPSRAQ